MHACYRLQCNVSILQLDDLLYSTRDFRELGHLEAPSCKRRLGISIDCAPHPIPERSMTMSRNRHHDFFRPSPKSRYPFAGHSFDRRGKGTTRVICKIFRLQRGSSKRGLKHQLLRFYSWYVLYDGNTIWDIICQAPLIHKIGFFSSSFKPQQNCFV